MSNIIVIEGPRATGKTTLTNMIKTFGYQVYKAERGVDPIDDMLRVLDSWSNGGKWVSDRFHLTEYVMSSYYQRVPLGKLETGIAKVQRKLEQLDAKIVVLTADREIRAARILSYGRDAAHRKDEMPEDDLYSQWTYTSVLFGVKVMSNNTKLDQARILFHLLLNNNTQRNQGSGMA